MGLKISDLIEKKELSWGDLEGRKLAVDTSQMLYQFVSSIRQQDGTPLKDSEGNVTSHLVGIFSRITNLMNKKMKLAFVFDGKPPALKVAEQEERSNRKRVAKEKYEEAKDKEDVDGMAKYAKQSLRVTKEMMEESKELLRAMGAPVIQAPSEAEAQASYMCKKGDVWGVASTDYDCLLYGAPKIVTNLTLSLRRRLPSGVYIPTHPELIELSEVLNQLKLDQDQLMSLAILVGTDYNIGGVKRIGPKKALALVQDLKTPEAIFATVETEFNWKAVWTTFKSMPMTDDYNLVWDKPDEDKIREILIEKHDFSHGRVEKTLEKLGKVKEDAKQKGLNDFFK